MDAEAGTFTRDLIPKIKALMPKMAARQNEFDQINRLLRGLIHRGNEEKAIKKALGLGPGEDIPEDVSDVELALLRTDPDVVRGRSNDNWWRQWCNDGLGVEHRPAEGT